MDNPNPNRTNLLAALLLVFVVIVAFFAGCFNGTPAEPTTPTPTVTLTLPPLPPTNTLTPYPTDTSTWTPTSTPSSTATRTVTSSPTATATPSPSSTPTAEPTITPTQPPLPVSGMSEQEIKSKTKTAEPTATALPTITPPPPPPTATNEPAYDPHTPIQFTGCRQYSFKYTVGLGYEVTWLCDGFEGDFRDIESQSDPIN